jgi:hypothetical protein
LVAFIGMLSYTARAEAADSVVLKYSFLRETISVPELSTFAETGELSTKLRVYLKLAGREPEQLRSLLTQEVKVNGVILSRMLNNPVGEAMLDQVSQVIHTPTNRASRESLRSALVSSALPDGQVTLIETLENYSTSEVHVEGDRLAEVAQTITKVLGRLPSLPGLPRIGL